MNRHLNDAVLRRYVDEPEALLSYEKEHLMQCLRCRSTLDAVRATAKTAAQALGDAEEEPDMAFARAAILNRAQRTNGVDLPAYARTARTGVRDWRWTPAVAAVVLFALLFSYAPFRAYAQNLLTIFEPREITPISLTRADVTQLRGVPELKELGTVHESGSDAMQRFTTFAAAAQRAQIAVLRPAYLPTSVPHTADYQVNPGHSVSFTFDEAKAKASAARRHFALPPPPKGLNGATLIAHVGPIVVQSYGVPISTLRAEHKKHEHELPRNAVVIVQLPSPSVRSTTVSADTIESYLLSLPNVPEDVKAQIRAIRDPASTLPVPVAIDKSTAQPVTINGARGLLIGDNTGVGSVIVWVSNGMIYSVAGGFTADEMTKVANSLHT